MAIFYSIILLMIWIIIFVIYAKIPLDKFGEERIKDAGLAFLIGGALQSFIFIEELFQIQILFTLSAIIIITACTFGLIFMLDSPWEFEALIPFSILIDSFLISLVLFYLPTHPVTLILLIIWEIIFAIYMFGLTPFLKSLDFRKKFGILLFMIGLSIQTFGYFSPLIHEIKNDFISTDITFISWSLKPPHGFVFLKMFNDLVFFIMSWIAISTFSILSFLPDANDPNYEELKKYTIIVLIFTLNCFSIALLIFWITNIVGIFILIPILVGVDLLVILKLTGKLLK